MLNNSEFITYSSYKYYIYICIDVKNIFACCFVIITNPFNLSGYETHITPSINDQTIQVNKEK